MKIFYSATRGFLFEGLHAEIPVDAIEIKASEHEALLAGQAAGKSIVGNKRGRPVLVDVAGPTTEEAIALAKRRRDRLLTECDYRAMPDYPQGDGEREAWLTYRQELRDLPAKEGFPANITWPTPPS